MRTAALAEPPPSFPRLPCWSSLPQQLFYPSFNSTRPLAPAVGKLFCHAPRLLIFFPAWAAAQPSLPTISSNPTCIWYPCLRPLHTQRCQNGMRCTTASVPSVPWWFSGGGCAELWADEPLQSPPGSYPAAVPGEGTAACEEPKPEANYVYASPSERPVFTIRNFHGKFFFPLQEMLLMLAKCLLCREPFLCSEKPSVHTFQKLCYQLAFN